MVLTWDALEVIARSEVFSASFLLLLSIQSRENFFVNYFWWFFFLTFPTLQALIRWRLARKVVVLMFSSSADYTMLGLPVFRPPFLLCTNKMISSSSSIATYNTEIRTYASRHFINDLHYLGPILLILNGQWETGFVKKLFLLLWILQFKKFIDLVPGFEFRFGSQQD